MKIENTSIRSYMVGLDIIKPNEIREVSDELGKSLLKQDGIIEHIDKSEVEALKQELAEAKAEVKKVKKAKTSK